MVPPGPDIPADQLGGQRDHRAAQLGMARGRLGEGLVEAVLLLRVGVLSEGEHTQRCGVCMHPLGCGSVLVSSTHYRRATP